ncbi:MAG: hypothetical protein M1546_19415 [Chloroflexi bacterium]|nr:hypothetical protein [Chloroflexota bacterium]
MLQASAGEIEHWVKHMEQERDNFRVALAWGLRDGHDTVTGVQMALWQFPRWSQFGARSEATEWLELALAHAGTAIPARLKAAILALLSDYLVVVNSPRAVALAHEAHHIFRAVGDSWEQLAMLHTLMNVEFEQSNTPAAQAVGEAAPGSPLRMDEYRVRVDAARHQLEAHALAAAESAGGAMRFEQAVDYALSL